MDSVFGIGAPELVLILLLAGIVMGPHRIRQVALWLGRTTAQLQAISRGFARQLNAELDTVDQGGDLRDTMNEMKELRRQITDLRKEITGAAISPVRESQDMLRESQNMLLESKAIIQNSIKPPKIAPSEEGKPNSEIEKEATPLGLPNLIEVPDDPE